MFDDDDDEDMFGESTQKVEEVKKKEEKPKHKVSFILRFVVVVFPDHTHLLFFQIIYYAPNFEKYLMMTMPGSLLKPIYRYCLCRLPEKNGYLLIHFLAYQPKHMFW